MNAERAIKLAIEYSKEDKTDILDFTRAEARLQTLESALESIGNYMEGEEENEIIEETIRVKKEFRKHWSVVIPIVHPEGKIICPGIVMLQVYEDNEEVIPFDVL